MAGSEVSVKLCSLYNSPIASSYLPPFSISHQATKSNDVGNLHSLTRSEQAEVCALQFDARLPNSTRFVLCGPDIRVGISSLGR
jgi:hypothetical protein